MCLHIYCYWHPCNDLTEFTTAFPCCLNSCSIFAGRLLIFLHNGSSHNRDAPATYLNFCVPLR